MSFLRRTSQLINDAFDTLDERTRGITGSGARHRASGSYGGRYGNASPAANSGQASVALPPPPPPPQYGQQYGQYDRQQIQSEPQQMAPQSPSPPLQNPPRQMPPPLPPRRSMGPPPPIPPRPASSTTLAGPTAQANGIQNSPPPVVGNAAQAPAQPPTPEAPLLSQTQAQAPRNPSPWALRETQTTTPNRATYQPPAPGPSPAASPASPRLPQTPQGPSQAYQPSAGGGGGAPPLPPRRPSMPTGDSTPSGGPTPPTPTSSQGRAADMGDPLGDIVTPFPVIRAQGAPLPTFSFCPQDNMVNWDATWYHLPGHEDFLMCTACHVRWFGDNNASPFVGSTRASGRCRFYKPRAKVLAAAAARAGAVQPLVEYVARRRNIPDCTEESWGVENSNGKWWTPGGGLYACEACYEDIVQATHLAQTWTMSPVAASRCDMAKFGMRSYIALSRANPSVTAIHEWIRSVAESKSLPPCTNLQGAKTQWYTTRRPIKDLVFCKTCHVTYFKYSPLDAEFVEAAPPPWGQAYTCDMTIYAQYALENSLLTGDFAPFWNAMRVLLSERFQGLEQCGTQHLSAGWKFYGLRGTSVDFDVCARHHASMLQTTGLAGFFYPKNDQIVRGCDFTQGSSRLITYILALSESVQKGLITPFADCLAQVDSGPPCPGPDPKAAATWYGFPDLRICPQCWTRFGSKAPLAAVAAATTPQCVLLPQPTICALSTYRMRVKWLDAGSDPAAILEYARYRQQVHSTIYVEYKRRHDSYEEKMALAATLLKLSLETTGTGNALALISDSGYRYGSDSGGWYENTTQAEGADLWRRYEATRDAAYAEAPKVNELLAEWMKVA